MKLHFQMMADYNHWANGRLYDAAAALSDAQYREDRGAFFRSLHGTLNHILVGDRIWLHRLTGEGPLPAKLGETLYDDLAGLRAARDAEDARIIHVVDSFGAEDWERKVAYRTTSDAPQETILREILAHLFNHQTHHRGQAHAILTALGQKSLELDLIYYLRSRPQYL